MSSTQLRETYAQLPVSSQQTLPAAPYTGKYIHCVFDDLHEAVQAAYALRAAGCDASNIHLMASWDYVEAIVRRQQRQSLIAKAVTRFLFYMDEGIGAIYLHEAQQGRHILAVRLASARQLEQVRNLLALHHAQFMKFASIWTVTDLPMSKQEELLTPMPATQAGAFAERGKASYEI